MVKIAVIGFGNIGTGLVELVERNKAIIARDCGTEVEIKYIVDIRDFTGHQQIQTLRVLLKKQA